MTIRSEYTANLMMTEQTELMEQIKRNRQVRAKVAKIRREIAMRKASEKKWWQIWR